MWSSVVLKLFGHFHVELEGEVCLELTLLFTSAETPHIDSPRSLLSLRILIPHHLQLRCAIDTFWTSSTFKISSTDSRVTRAYWAASIDRQSNSNRAQNLLALSEIIMFAISDGVDQERERRWWTTWRLEFAQERESVKNRGVHKIRLESASFGRAAEQRLLVLSISIILFQSCSSGLRHPARSSKHQDSSRRLRVSFENIVHLLYRTTATRFNHDPA